MVSLRKLLPRFSLRTLAIFTLLATSGFGLWWHWAPWYEVEMRLFTKKTPFDSRMPKGNDPSFPAARHLMGNGRFYESPIVSSVSSDGTRLASLNECVDDGYDGRVLMWKPVPCVAVGRFATKDEGSVLKAEPVRKRPKPQLLCELTLRNGVEYIGNDCNLGFYERGEKLIVVTGGGRAAFRRRRPEWWWGVFWLWEFWLTAAFGGLFVWSVVRDRKALARVTPSPLVGEGGDGG